MDMESPTLSFKTPEELYYVLMGAQYHNLSYWMEIWEYSWNTVLMQEYNS